MMKADLQITLYSNFRICREKKIVERSFRMKFESISKAFLKLLAFFVFPTYTFFVQLEKESKS
jgi:hypothetical protein